MPDETKVALVNMPFGYSKYPSIQLGTLSALLKSQGIGVDGFVGEVGILDAVLARKHCRKLFFLLGAQFTQALLLLLLIELGHCPCIVH